MKALTPIILSGIQRGEHRQTLDHQRVDTLVRDLQERGHRRRTTARQQQSRSAAQFAAGFPEGSLDKGGASERASGQEPRARAATESCGGARGSAEARTGT